MRVCYFGAYDRSHSRNVVLVKGLRKVGADVVECHTSVATKLSRYPALAAKFAWTGRVADVVVVGASGHAYVPLARALASMAAKPVIFDAFVSQYDTSIIDRREASPRSIRAKYCLALDRVATALADVVVIDTPEHAEYYADLTGQPPGRFRWVPAGADEDVFYPRARRSQSSVFVVAFVGTFIPLHGVEHILDAAKILESRPDIAFQFIGRGQTYTAARRLATQLALKNVTFVDPVPTQVLPSVLEGADICLGIFGTTPKAQRVIPIKVYTAMAMGKPIITGDSPAVRQLLADGHDALLVPVGSGHAIASAVETLLEDHELRGKLGRNALTTFRRRAATEVIGKRFLDICAEALVAMRSRSASGGGFRR